MFSLVGQQIKIFVLENIHLKTNKDFYLFITRISDLPYH